MAIQDASRELERLMVTGPAAPHLDTSVIDLCDDTVLQTNDEAVYEDITRYEDNNEDEGSSVLSSGDMPLPEQTILIEDEEEDDQEAQVMAFNTRGVAGAEATIVISESEEEEEREEETLNILTIRCPICLAGFREIKNEGNLNDYSIKVNNALSNFFYRWMSLLNSLRPHLL